MIRISVDDSRRTRFIVYEGIVDDVELLKAYKELVARPDFNKTYNDFVDLTHVDEFQVTSKGISDLAAFLKPYIGELATTKLAIVATKPYIYGMARMYQSVRDDAPRKIKVFRDADEAFFWLGIPPLK